MDNPYPKMRLFAEPRCHTYIAIAIAGVGVAGSLGLGGASAAGAFSPSIPTPNTAAEAEQMQQLQAQYLPEILGIEAAGQEGGTYTLPKNIAKQLEEQGFKFSDWKKNKSGQPTISFAGKGTANAQGAIEQQLAQGQLEEGQQLDPQEIATQLAQEQQADPQQFAARAAEYGQLENAIQNPQTSPVSQTLQNQTSQQVAAGSLLTPEEQSMLNQAVSQNGVNYGTDLTTGFEGEQRALTNADAGSNFLATGETPADIAYRQQQQNIANLAAYSGGQTPEAQFGEVSGANQPVAPEFSTSYQPSYSGAAAAQEGAAGGIQQYGENVQEQLQQANPWVTGLSSVLNVGNALASAGGI
jgi:hypothetical protein